MWITLPFPVFFVCSVLLFPPSVIFQTRFSCASFCAIKYWLINQVFLHPSINLSINQCHKSSTASTTDILWTDRNSKSKIIKGGSIHFISFLDYFILLYFLSSWRFSFFVQFFLLMQRCIYCNFAWNYSKAESYGMLRELYHTSNRNLHFGHRPIFKIIIISLCLEERNGPHDQLQECM